MTSECTLLTRMKSHGVVLTLPLSLSSSSPSFVLFSSFLFSFFSPPFCPSHFFSFPSSSSSLWKQLPTTQRRELLEGGDKGKEDGEFWMSYDDFRKHYTDFEICNICMEQLYEDETGQGSKVRSEVIVLVLIFICLVLCYVLPSNHIATDSKMSIKHNRCPVLASFPDPCLMSSVFNCYQLSKTTCREGTPVQFA